MYLTAGGGVQDKNRQVPDRSKQGGGGLFSVPQLEKQRKSKNKWNMRNIFLTLRYLEDFQFAGNCRI